jgi:Phosphosulfolactate phosphohydrolase and related enzymes
LEIVKVDFVKGAKAATGVVVVIDVFRAFTTACVCFAKGAQRVVAVGNSDKALGLRRGDNTLLLGERFGKRIEGFDFGNSPTDVAAVDLTGKTIVHTTHAGTQGLVNATQASAIFTGALVNAKATVLAIKALQPQRVTLVRMGLNAEQASDEDSACADYLEALLLAQPVDEPKILDELRASPYSQRFFDPNQPWSPASDFDWCLRFNCFDFALRATPLNDYSCELMVVN